MAQPTDLETRILEHAEKREQNSTIPFGSTIVEFQLSPTRYTQILMHLVRRPEVVADPRWTGMAYRIQRVMAANELMRAARRLPRRSA